MDTRRKHKQKTIKTTVSTPTIRCDAAGIDIGAEEVYAAVPHDRTDEPVRRFATFTADLLELAQWLKDCGIKTVAMESTGVYWIPVFQILETQGFEVYLVNAHHVKHVPGRKSDVSDCQWLQYLHAVGLLNRSFRPPDAVCALRSILRHRGDLVTDAGTHVQKMQKALNQMNIHLHHVITDITGKTGMAIIDAIVSGERDPAKLALLRDCRIKASAKIIEKALVGDWRHEHLFTLGQSLVLYRYYQVLIEECDSEIVSLLQSTDPGRSMASDAPSVTSQRCSPKRHEAVISQQEQLLGKQEPFDLRSELNRLLGTDLTLIPGIDVASAQKIYSELGANLKAQFATSARFASWLGVVPDNRVSGGKTLSVKTRDIKSPVATTLRISAMSLERSKSALGDYYRRMKTRLGAPKAITATAAKLARIIFHLVTTGKSYDESIFQHIEEQAKIRKEGRLRKIARDFGYDLVPKQEVAI